MKQTLHWPHTSLLDGFCHTFVFYIFFHQPLYFCNHSSLQITLLAHVMATHDTHTHTHKCECTHTHTLTLLPTSSCQQFSISRESSSADANMESMCFSQCDLWPLRLTHRWEAPFLFLLRIPPHNLLKATISSLLSLTTDNAVMYACLRAAVWLMLGDRNGHFTPTTLQLLFSSAWQTECFQQQDELLAVESCLA